MCINRLHGRCAISSPPSGRRLGLGDGGRDERHQLLKRLNRSFKERRANTASLHAVCSHGSPSSTSTECIGTPSPAPRLCFSHIPGVSLPLAAWVSPSHKPLEVYFFQAGLQRHFTAFISPSVHHCQSCSYGMAHLNRRPGCHGTTNGPPGVGTLAPETPTRPHHDGYPGVHAI